MFPWVFGGAVLRLSWGYGFSAFTLWAVVGGAFLGFNSAYPSFPKEF
jgi:hypothetical protein